MKLKSHLFSNGGTEKADSVGLKDDEDLFEVARTHPDIQKKTLQEVVAAMNEAGMLNFEFEKCILPIFGHTVPENVNPVILDDAYQREMDHFKNIADTLQKEAEIDETSMPCVMQLLSTIDNACLRFIGAFCLKTIFRAEIHKNKQFK